MDEPATTILKRLGLFNPTVKTQGWKVYAAIKTDARENEQVEARRTLVVGIPDSQLAPLSALQHRPFYDLGRVLFQVSGPNDNLDQAGHSMAAATAQQADTVEPEESKNNGEMS